MDINDYKKYLKYKKKYLDLKAYQKELAIKNEGGNILDTLGGILNSAFSCTDYYNKDKDGTLKFCYHFGSFDKMKVFLKKIQSTGVEYNDTILHELIKKRFEIERLPELVKILLKLRLTESKLLELILSKQQVNDYELILQKDYKNGGVNGIIQTALHKSISPHFITSLKQILYIEDDNIDRDNINIWDAYSDVLSFYSCIADSNTLYPIVNINKKILDSLDKLQLPISLVFLESLANRKHKTGVIKQNIKDLYIQNNAITIPSEEVQTAYNNTRNFTLEDFLNSDKNTFGILPPSVLLLLSMKFNQKNDSNGWNKTIKKMINNMGILCSKEDSRQAIIEAYLELIDSEEESSNGTNLIEDLKKVELELNVLNNIYKDLSSEKSKSDGKTIEQKCSIVKARGVKDSVKALFTKLKTKVGSDNKGPTLCREYYTLKNKKHSIEKEIEERTRQETGLKKSTTANQLLSSIITYLIHAKNTRTEICHPDPYMTWDLFDGILNKFNSLSKIDLSRFDSINHSTIQSVIAFATFLPFDLKELLYHVLGTKEDRKENFEKLYETYRMEIYSKFVEPLDGNYYLRNTGDAPYNPEKPDDLQITSPLWPPTSLFNKIKKETLPEKKEKILDTFKSRIKSIFSKVVDTVNNVANLVSDKIKITAKKLSEEAAVAAVNYKNVVSSSAEV